MEYENLSEANEICKVIDKKQSLISNCANAHSIVIGNTENYAELCIDIQSSSKDVFKDNGDQLLTSIRKQLENEIQELKVKLIKL